MTLLRLPQVNRFSELNLKLLNIYYVFRMHFRSINNLTIRKKCNVHSTNQEVQYRYYSIILHTGQQY